MEVVACASFFRPSLSRGESLSIGDLSRVDLGPSPMEEEEAAAS